MAGFKTNLTLLELIQLSQNKHLWWWTFFSKLVVLLRHDDSYHGDGDGGVAHLGEAAGPLQPSLVSPTGCLTRAGQHLTKIIVVRSGWTTWTVKRMTMRMIFLILLLINKMFSPFCWLWLDLTLPFFALPHLSLPLPCHFQQKLYPWLPFQVFVLESESESLYPFVALWFSFKEATNCQKHQCAPLLISLIELSRSVFRVPSAVLGPAQHCSCDCIRK